MAWIECRLGLNKPKDKTLSVNKGNFPSLSSGISGCHTITKSDNYVRGHSSNEDVLAYVDTGQFNVKGYSKIEINYSTECWGPKPGTPSMRVNGSVIGWCVQSGSGTMTYNINNQDEITVQIRYETHNDQSDCWLAVSLSSIHFIP